MARRGNRIGRSTFHGPIRRTGATTAGRARATWGEGGQDARASRRAGRGAPEPRGLRVGGTCCAAARCWLRLGALDLVLKAGEVEPRRVESHPLMVRQRRVPFVRSSGSSRFGPQGERIHARRPVDRPLDAVTHDRARHVVPGRHWWLATGQWSPRGAIGCERSGRRAASHPLCAASGSAALGTLGPVGASGGP